MSSIHLSTLSRRGDDDDAFPFTVPAIRTLAALPLERPVTFFVGENGSGKSTLLEGIAALKVFSSSFSRGLCPVACSCWTSLRHRSRHRASSRCSR